MIRSYTTLDTSCRWGITFSYRTLHWHWGGRIRHYSLDRKGR